MYRVTIVQLDPDANDAGPRYEQIVDQLDLVAVINAVNSTPQSQRQRALRSDAGKPRKIPDTMAMTPDEVV